MQQDPDFYDQGGAPAGFSPNAVPPQNGQPARTEPSRPLTARVSPAPSCRRVSPLIIRSRCRRSCLGLWGPCRQQPMQQMPPFSEQPGAFRAARRRVRPAGAGLRPAARDAAGRIFPSPCRAEPSCRPTCPRRCRPFSPTPTISRGRSSRSRKSPGSRAAAKRVLAHSCGRGRHRRRRLRLQPLRLRAA